MHALTNDEDEATQPIDLGQQFPHVEVAALKYRIDQQTRRLTVLGHGDADIEAADVALLTALQGRLEAIYTQYGKQPEALKG